MSVYLSFDLFEVPPDPNENSTANRRVIAIDSRTHHVDVGIVSELPYSP